MSDNILEIRNLKVFFYTEEGEVRAVNDVTLDLPRGKIVALVGESGSGKSVTSYSILRLIQKPGKIVGGSIKYYPAKGEPVDIAALPDNSDRLFDIRGNRISMIFQEPMTALSPVHTVGNQLSETLLLHEDISAGEAEKRAIDMLRRVGIPAPERRIKQYPFELSGGMRQRVVIAMAMLADPDLLIADEPTTALDVTIQSQVLHQINKLQREEGNSVLLVTHDLGVVAQTADLVAVMYLGRIVEKGTVRQIMKDPRHPYTMGLLESLPGLHLDHDRLPSIKGTVPSLIDLPLGCPFHPRCPFAKAGVCDQGAAPPLEDFGEGRQAACYRLEEIAEVGGQRTGDGVVRPQ